MNTLKAILKSACFQCFLLAVGLVLVYNTSAFAALEDSIGDIQSKIQAICTPLAIIFLIVAGWQKAIGNNFMFFVFLLKNRNNYHVAHRISFKYAFFFAF
jgi:hypothetical protein